MVCIDYSRSENMHRNIHNSYPLKCSPAGRVTTLALFCFISVPLFCHAAVTVGTVTSKNSGANTSLTLPISGDTWTHTVSGSNTLLLVAVSLNQSSAKESVSTITFNGKALTKIGEAARNNEVQTEIWYRLAPDAGTYNVLVTLTAAASFVAGAITLNGVDQTTPLGTYFGTSGNGTSASATVSSESDGLVVDILGYASSTPTSTVGAGQTQQWAQVTTNGNATTNVRGYSSTEAGASSVAMSWAISPGIKWAFSAIPIVPALDRFNYRKSITIDRSKVGVTGTSTTTLSNYPVLVNVTDSDLKSASYGGYVQSSSGYDIVFRGVNNAVCGGAAYNPCTLSHQIEEYNQTTGKLVAWVKLPSVYTNAASTNTTFYMYFGNSSISSSLEQTTGVWDSNFQAVWHMADNIASSSVAQSTSITTIGNGILYDGASTINTSTRATTGQISGALSFNGTGNYIAQTNTTAISNPQNLTLSAWINTGTASGRKVMGFEGSRTGTASANWDRMMWIGTDGKAYAGCCYGTTAFAAASTSTLSDSTWHYLVAQVLDSGYVLRIYIDGSFISSTSVGNLCENTSGYWRIGSYKLQNWTNGSDGYFTGSIDEARISNAIRSADWIKTDYNNQSSPSTFYSMGLRETSPITPVELISFTATDYSGLVQLKWKTGFEADNLGFRIHREDVGGLTRITPSMVAGSALVSRNNVALTSGRTYIWHDFVADPSKLPNYWLEEIDMKGRSTWHGPAATTIAETELPQQVQSVVLSHLGKGASKIKNDGSNWRYWSNGTRREALNVSLISTPQKSIDSNGRSVQPKFPLAVDPVQPLQALSIQADPVWAASVKIKINKEGWYRVTQPQLVLAGLGTYATPQNLRLYTEGIEQPIMVFTCGGLARSSVNPDSSYRERGANRVPRRPCEGKFGENDWIEFYATGLDSQYTDSRAYWLVDGTEMGKRIVAVDESTTLSGTTSLLTTIEFRPKTIYVPELRNGDGNNFFGSVVSFEGDDERLILNHLDSLASGDNLLEVRLQGAIDVPHNVQVQINGIPVGSFQFEGMATGTGFFSLPPGLLLPGENHIGLSAQNGEDDISLLEYLRVSYWRNLYADDDYLPITVDGNQSITVGGFKSSAIRVIDITDPDAPTELLGNIAPKEGLFAITVSIRGSETRNLIAFAEPSGQTPSAIAPNNRSNWSKLVAGADVIIISHSEFIWSLRSLTEQHKAEGYSVALVDIEDLYDEFNYGHKSPDAVKDFLQKAFDEWKTKPKFLLFAGDASFDPRNYLGLGDFDYVPTKFVNTDLMETASDDWFADFDNDGIPEIAVGRLSVRTPAQAAAQVAKIVAYKQAALYGSVGSWADTVALVADSNDGYDFESASNQVFDLLPDSLSAAKIYRGQISDTEARDQILQNLNAGALLVNYFGHGSVELWRGSLLTSADPAGLTNGTKLPLLIAMTCLNGYFIDIYTESLAEALMKAPNGGAVGVWASSGLTDAQFQQVMNHELFTQLFYYSQTVGEAIVKAKASVQNLDVRKTWIFFGDPTMRLPF